MEGCRGERGQDITTVWLSCWFSKINYVAIKMPVEVLPNKVVKVVNI